jgi:hypothetical protein
MKRQNLGRTNRSHYQSLYLWTRFFLGMISLGIIIWQRKQTSFVIPTEIRDLRNGVHNEISRGIYPEERRARNDNAFFRDDNFIVTYSTQLILSALSFQQSGRVATVLLFGLGSYFIQVKAQPTVPALTVNLNNLKPDEGVVFSSGNAIDVGDVNGDGHVDMLIGNYQANAAYLIYGPNFESSNNLAALNANQTVTFLGGLNSGTGVSVKIVDINKDGKLDLLIGATEAEAGAGKVYLVYGNHFASTVMLDALDSLQGVIFYGSSGATGFHIDAGDLNNDGYIDLLIAAIYSGKVYLIYGPNFLNASNLENLAPPQGIIFSTSDSASSLFLKDVTKDGALDILIGDYGSSKTFLIYGPNFENASNLNNLSANQGVIFSGGVETGIATYANDMNNDSYLDVLIGARGAASTYVVFGPNFSNATHLEALAYNQGIVFSGGINTGQSVLAGDANNDGYQDVFIGAYDDAATAGVRSVYLVFGPNFAETTDLNNLNVMQGIVFTGGQNIGLDVLLYDFNNDSKLDAFICSNNGDPAYLVYNHVFNVLKPAFTPSTTPAIVTTSPTSTTKSTSSSGEMVTTTVDQTNRVSTISMNLNTLNSASGSTPVIPSTQNNNNIASDIAGTAVGVCVVGTLLGGAVGFFAANKCRKKKEKANNNSHQDINLGNNFTRAINSSQYSAANATNVQKNYREIDETKQDEKQYENVPKLEI